MSLYSEGKTQAGITEGRYHLHAQKRGFQEEEDPQETLMLNFRQVPIGSSLTSGRGLPDSGYCPSLNLRNSMTLHRLLVEGL